MDPAGIYHLELHPRFTLVISGFNNNSLFYVHIIHCSCRSSRGGGMCVYVCVGERGPRGAQSDAGFAIFIARFPRSPECQHSGS